MLFFIIRCIIVLLNMFSLRVVRVLVIVNLRFSMFVVSMKIDGFMIGEVS